MKSPNKVSCAEDGTTQGIDFAAQRAKLVATLLHDGHLRDPRVAEAMRIVPRELFLDAEARARAYEDHPLSIGWGQTMSAPHMVAIMCEALELVPGHRVLEVGTGSGYHAAVVAKLVDPGSVTTIEYHAALARWAQENLRQAGVLNVRALAGDGGRGVPDDAPYDRIYLTCSAPRIPGPLRSQLAPGGILVAPIGELPSRLLRLRFVQDEWVEEDLGPCAFVPLRGEFGVE